MRFQKLCLLQFFCTISDTLYDKYPGGWGILAITYRGDLPNNKIVMALSNFNMGVENKY